MDGYRCERYTDRKEEQLRKRLISLYAQSMREMENEYNRYVEGWDEEKNGKTIHHKGLYERREEQYALFKQGLWKDKEGRTITDENEFNRWFSSQERRGEYWLSVRNQLAERIVHADEIASAIINGETPKVYSMAFNELGQEAIAEARRLGITFNCSMFSAKELELVAKYRNNLQGVNFAILDDKLIKAILGENDIFQIEKLLVNRNIDAEWLSEKLENQLVLGLLNGDDLERLAERLRSVIRMKQSSAIRLCRSALNNARNCALNDRMEELYNRGCITTKWWKDVHDSVPPERQAHWDAGNEYTRDNAIPYNEPFIVGGESLMYPCDPNASGWNKWNCRCQLRHGDFKFTSILSEEERKRANVRVTVRY